MNTPNSPFYFLPRCEQVRQILQDTKNFPTWDSAIFACAILGSYRRLNERIAARNQEARDEVLRPRSSARFLKSGETVIKGDEFSYDGTSWHPCVGSVGMKLNDVDAERRCVRRPLVVELNARQAGKTNEQKQRLNERIMATYSSSVPYLVSHEDGVPVLRRNEFGEAIMESYRKMNARHEAQYESELVRLSDPKPCRTIEVSLNGGPFQMMPMPTAETLRRTKEEMTRLRDAHDAAEVAVWVLRILRNLTH